ncbi:MAG: Tfp pilus assembly protein FimT/FimU [Opitutales bacterium]
MLHHRALQANNAPSPCRHAYCLPSSKSTRTADGFTLIEILLVLGLIALAGSLVVTNFGSLLDRSGDSSVEEQLRSAVREARFIAARDRIATSLEYDPMSGSFNIRPASETADISSDSADSADSVDSAIAAIAYPLPEPFDPEGRGEIRFYLVPPAEGMRGSFSAPEETREPLAKVRFAPDRSSTPFVVEIDSGSGTPERLVFDPFSDLLRSTSR